MLHVFISSQGSLESGQVFDSSRERDPFTIELGAGKVIKGRVSYKF